KLLAKLRRIPQLTDVNSDQQDAGLAATIAIDRDSAARLGESTATIDNTLYDAFGQREVSTMYTPLNQYFVVMEAAPQFWQSPESLHGIHLGGATSSSAPPASGAAASATVASLSASANAAGASTYAGPAGLIGGVLSAAGSSVSPLSSAATASTSSL